jgi:flavodoxin I
MKLGLFYGTTTGFTETYADEIRALLGDSLTVYKNISESTPEDLSSCDSLILGIPTWDVGQLQSDWWAFLPKFDSIDLHGKKVAFFGVGDQYGYPDTFLDAMGDLWKKVEERGGELIAQWPKDGYDFTSPKPVVNGKFIGLALDPVNQEELSKDRIKKWVEQLKAELHLETLAAAHASRK